MNRKLAVRLLIILLLAGGVIFLAWYSTLPEPVVVQLYTVTGGRVEASVSNTRVGTVKACRRSMLAPAMGGEVAVLAVKEGDRVDQGQVLLEIWNEDLKAELELARTQQQASEARVREACEMAAGADRELKRLQSLSRDRMVAEERVDQALTESQARRAACDAARATARVSAAQIEVARARLDRTIVHAPFDGVVAEVNAELGAFVTPSPLGIQTLPAIDLLDISCLYVSAPIDEVDAPPLVPGMRACISLDAFPDRLCNAFVRRIAPYVLDLEKQARTVEVEVEIEDPADVRGMLPGYSADIEIALEVREDVLRIPTEAVLENNRVLFYNTATGLLEDRVIEPGLSNWNYTEVLSGLTEGDRIVTAVGREGIAAGVRVIPGSAED